jgi:hypothetical protein
MNLVTSFDPSVTQNGQFNSTLSINGRMVVYNESNVGIQLQFADGSTAYCAAWTTEIYSQPTPDPNVLWSQENILGGSTGPISKVTVVAYLPNEKVMGVYPFSLVRQFFLGNNVNVNLPTSTNLQNDNNVTGTQIIESTVSGSPSSNVSVYNDGSGWFGRWNTPTFTKVLQWFSSGATGVMLGAVGFLTEVLGNLKVDGTLESVGNVTADANLAVTGTATFNANGVSIDGSSNVNCNAVNTNTVNTGVVNATTANATTTNTTTLSATGNIISANNQSHEWKDFGGTVRPVLNVDASNHVNLSGITGTDLLQFLASGGGVTGVWDFINKSLDIRTTAVILNGTTNGTAELYMPFTGANFKMCILYFNAYRNASGTSQNINLPVAFAGFANFVTANGKVVTPRSGGVNLVNKVNIITALAAGGGTAVNQSTIPSYCVGDIFQTFDSFDLGNTQATNATAVYAFVGL